MVDLIVEFGGGVVGLNQPELLDYVRKFAAEHWDFRQGRERQQASRPAQVDVNRRQIILDAAQELGLMGVSGIALLTVNVVVVLAGTVWATRDRLLRALELLHDSVAAERLVILGGDRFLSDGERAWFGEMGLPDCRDEASAMRAIVSHEESPLGHVGDGDPPIEILIAPSGQPAHRTNTEDQLRYLDEHTKAAGTALCVTNAIYVPYQGATAVRCLGFESGWGVEMASVAPGPSSADSWYLYLQEIKAAIDAMIVLRRYLADQTP